jgi:hypothetical protein
VGNYILHVGSGGLAVSGQAGADEVEVTPAMRQAGLEAYWEHDRENDESLEIVRDVFIAMALVALRDKNREASWLRV